MWVANGNENQKWKKRQKTETCVIDDEVLLWFSKLRERNLPVSGPMIQEKSKEVAEKHGFTKFQGSNGWLEKFRRSHNIAHKAVCGEAASVDKDMVEQWKAKIAGIIAKYDARNIFNADEKGLFYRVLPSKTMAFKDDKCTGGKVSKEWLCFCAATWMENLRGHL